MIHNKKIPGWANSKILDVLGQYAFEVADNGTIIELGGLFGRSTYTLGKNKKDSVKLITIDIWPTMLLDTIGPVHDGTGGVIEMALLECKLTHNPRTIHGDDFHQLWKLYTHELINNEGIRSHTNLNNDNFPQVDLIYQDAAHDYKGVYDDLVHWFPKLKQDGVMILDDYEPGWPGVMQAVDQYVTEHDLETSMVTNRNILLRRK